MNSLGLYQLNELIIGPFILTGYTVVKLIFLNIITFIFLLFLLFRGFEADDL